MKEGWIYKNLNEVCEKGSSSITINKLGDCNGDYPLFGASGLVKCVDFYHQDKPYIGIVKDGAGVGRVDIYPAYSSLVGTMQYIFAKEECLLDYLKYFLVKLDLSHCVSGATIPHIYFKDYGKEKIPVPSIGIQQDIVSELNKINELIALKKSQLNDFDYLIQSIFYEMFGDPVENSKGWEVNPLGTIADFKNGINFSKGESGNCYKFLGVSDFQDNKTVSSSSLGDIHLTEDLSDDYMLKTGDIVFVRSNGSKELVGRNILMLVDEPTTFSGFCIRCRLTDKDFNSVYLSCLLKASSMRPIITNSGRGCNISNLNQKILSALPIIHPSLDLQDSFALYVSAIENQKSQLKSIILDLETLLAARLQYWFN